jgi:hypothetical protein
VFEKDWKCSFDQLPHCSAAWVQVALEWRLGSNEQEAMPKSLSIVCCMLHAFEESPERLCPSTSGGFCNQAKGLMCRFVCACQLCLRRLAWGCCPRLLLDNQFELESTVRLVAVGYCSSLERVQQCLPLPELRACRLSYYPGSRRARGAHSDRLTFCFIDI